MKLSCPCSNWKFVNAITNFYGHLLIYSTVKMDSIFGYDYEKAPLVYHYY